MKTFATLALITLLALAVPAFALDKEGGVRLVIGDPTGNFGKSVDNVGAGLMAHIGLRPAPAWSIGLGLHGLIYGSESTEYDMPLVDEFKMTTTNNLAGGYLFTRLSPLRGAVQPYGEARLGLNYLWTESKLEDDDWWSDDSVARETNFDDWAGYWSLGGGLLIRLASGDPVQNHPGVFLDLGATYQNGNKAEYLAEGGVAIVDDRPVFSPSNSETDLVSYEAGVVLTF